jgi:hypothetical protein
VLLTHDRLDHLARTVSALRERTPEPIRLTVVDNASQPAVRQWLADHRGWFHQVIPRASNEHVPAFQHGIDATSSDPFVVTDPDLVVPDVSPSWLAQLLELLERHPDFGLIGVELDPSNSPLTPAEVAALRDERGHAGDDLREGNVGTHLQLIRRAALREPYTSDREVCEAVRRAGYRVGWTPRIQALHLGFDDVRLHPEYLRRKDATGRFYPSYASVLDGAERPPSLAALARAAPVIALVRAAGIPDASVLELTARRPLLSCVLPAAVRDRPARRLPYPDGSAAAVVLVDAPSALREAARVATHLVVLVTSLAAVDARLPDELAPHGWRGRELPGAGDPVVRMAELADRELDLGLQTVEHREDWLELFAGGAFGEAEQRLFVFEPEQPAAAPPERVGGRRRRPLLARLRAAR